MVMVPFGREEGQSLAIESLRPTIPASSLLSLPAVTACKRLAAASESTQIVSVARAPHDQRRTIWPDIIADRAFCAFNRDHKDRTSGADYAFYRGLLARHCREAGVEVWAWVLTPNHVHLIVNPSDTDGLRRALAQVHRRHAGHVHARQKKTGHFWQGRFGAAPIDEAHLAAALRYVAMNPVRARLVERPQDWRWSSAWAHLSGVADGVTFLAPVRDRFPRFADLLDDAALDALQTPLRQAEAVGRPLGDAAFLAVLEAATQRRLRPMPRGPKPKEPAYTRARN